MNGFPADSVERRAAHSMAALLTESGRRIAAYDRCSVVEDESANRRLPSQQQAVIDTNATSASAGTSVGTLALPS